jgi:hypothetical protein
MRASVADCCTITREEIQAMGNAKAKVVTQGKTGQKLRIAVEGALGVLIDRIKGRSYKVTSLALVRNENGQPLSYFALDSRFEAARTRVATKLKDEKRDDDAQLVLAFQFRDLRAKAGTDQADATDIRTAQQQLVTRISRPPRSMSEHGRVRR